MALRAVIDIGSNSVKLLVAEVVSGRLEERKDRVVVTRLASGLRRTGRIGEAGVRRTVDALRGFREEAARAGAESLVGVGTQALRRAENAAEVLLRFRRACGLDVEVLPGDHEARFSWIAALSGLPDPDLSAAVFDTGGGSTEFARGRGGRIEESFSLPVGVRGPTEEYGLGRETPEERVEAFLRSLSESLAAVPLFDGTLIGVGGTVLTLASVAAGATRYDPALLAGVPLSRTEVDRQIGIYRDLPAEARRGIPGMVPERADVVLAGAAIVRAILERTGRDSLAVSARGLRHGVLLDRYGGLD